MAVQSRRTGGFGLSSRVVLTAGFVAAGWLGAGASTSADAEPAYDTLPVVVPSVSRAVVPDDGPGPRVYWEPSRLPDIRRENVENFLLRP